VNGDGLAITQVGESIDVTLDPSSCSLDVAQRAAIKFTHLASFDFVPTSAQLCVRIQLFADAGMAAERLGQIFRNEILDQTLRARIFEETAAERNLILAHTFSRSRLVSQQ
jgi:His-Xaa-Ser system protein HxsD